MHGPCFRSSVAVIRKSAWPEWPWHVLIRAWLLAAVFSGVPSTLYALWMGHNPLTATEAAGRMFVPSEAPAPVVYAAALFTHLAVSAFWTLAIAHLLPARRAWLWACAFGTAIAVLDLLLIGRAFPSVAALDFSSQWADHVAFAGLVCGVLAKEKRAAGRAV